jgi:diguanylate cyclase (GGDEF)-like protein
LATGAATLLAVGLIRWRETTSTVGRDVGDRLLREAAARIVAHVANGQDAATVARIGESTFAVLLPGDDPATASAAALRLIDAFDQPYREAELTIDTPVAVGVASATERDSDAAQLPRHAEIALAEAAHTETRFAVYRHASDPYRPERLSLMGELRAGLTRREFRLAY